MAITTVAPVASLIVGSGNIREYKLGRGGDKGSESNELHGFKILVFVVIRGDCMNGLRRLSQLCFSFILSTGTLNDRPFENGS